MVTTQVLLSAGGPLRQQSYQLLSLLLPTWENRDCVEVILGGPADLPQLVVSCSAPTPNSLFLLSSPFELTS